MNCIYKAAAIDVTFPVGHSGCILQTIYIYYIYITFFHTKHFNLQQNKMSLCPCLSSCSLSRDSHPIAPSGSRPREVQTLSPASLSSSQPLAFHTDRSLTAPCTLSKKLTWVQFPRPLFIIPVGSMKIMKARLYPASSPCDSWWCCNNQDIIKAAFKQCFFFLWSPKTNIPLFNSVCRFYNPFMSTRHKLVDMMATQI